MDFGVIGVPVEVDRKFIRSHGVVLPMAVGTKGQIDMPESVAPTLSPISGDFMHAGLVEFMSPEVERAITYYSRE